MKVNLSYGYNAVILPLTKLNIKSKTFFTKVAQFGMLLEKCCIKGESLAVIPSRSSHFVTFSTRIKSKNWKLKLAITCKISFLSLVVVRVVIFCIKTQKCKENLEMCVFLSLKNLHLSEIFVLKRDFFFNFQAFHIFI